MLMSVVDIYVVKIVLSTVKIVVAMSIIINYINYMRQ